MSWWRPWWPSGGVSSAYAQQFVPIPQPVGAVYPYFATDVNDAGAVVGQYWDEDGRVHSTLLVNGVHQSIDVPGAWGTQAQGINNLGQVVGTFVLDPAENATPFIYANGTHVPLALPGALALPLDINDHGVMVGTTWDASFLFTSAFVVGPNGSQLLRYPGASFTSLEGINNAGNAVGGAWDSFSGTPLRYANGALSVPDPLPGSAGCSVNGISDSGDLVGGCSDSSGQGTSGFLFTGGESLRLTYGGDPSTFFRNVSASGIIVGSSNSGSFLVMRSKIVDPVPDLLDEGGVTDEADDLASMGRLVQGVAADGVARVVVRIPATTAGQQFTVRVLNDHAPRTLSTSDNEDGALAAIGAQSSWVSQITVTAVTVAGASPMAFVVYKAPEDFPRADGQDEARASRQVFLEITPMGGQPFVQVVEIVRPPVMLVHGVWSNADSWRFFSPLATGVDPRFTAERADFSAFVDVVSALPAQPEGSLTRIRASALGLEFNAKKVQEQADALVDDFSKGFNRLGVAVASARVDFVGHSMGGVVVRTLSTLPKYLSPRRFGAGLIHKLITMNTPHRGSPMAAGLLQANNTCLRASLVDLEVNEFLGLTLYTKEINNFSILQATLASGEAVSGAIGDLADAPLSAALQRLAASPVALPIAYVATSYERWGALNGFRPDYLRGHCPTDPLAQALTPSAWPMLFGGPVNSTDGVVGRASQVDGASTAVEDVPDHAHSGGMLQLGFEPPHAQYPGEVQVAVVRALNRPVYLPAYFRPTP